MSAERRRSVAAAVLVTLALTALAGCGGEEEQQTLDLDADSSPSASDEPSQGRDSGVPAGVPEPRPAPEQGQPVEQTDAGVYALELPEQPQKRAAAQAYVDYLDTRTQAFNTGVVDLPALSGTAMGEALTSVQGYTRTLAEAEQRTVGDAWIRVTDAEVDVQGRTATVTGLCTLNASVDVDADGVAQESPPDAYLIDATVRRVGPDAWLVESFVPEAVASC